MWCIIIRTTKGEYIRELMNTKPSNVDIMYFEQYYADDLHERTHAVVVNVFEIGD